jgi:aminoglycoside phosphotransferase (APT) family kinase protein
VQPADEALLQRDPGLSGLRVLLDDGALTAWLLASGVDLAAPVGRRYLRYKPGTSAVLGARLTTAAGQLDAVVTAYAGDGRTLSSKPQRRLVALLAAPDGTPAVLQAYRPDAVAAAAQAYAGALRAGRAAGLRLPRVLEADPARGVLVVEHLPGEVLDRSAGPALEDGLQRAGALLAGLHGGDPDGLRGPQEQLEPVRAAAEQVGRLLPDLAAQVRDLAHDVEVALRDPELPVPVHGDFSADQVVLTASGNAHRPRPRGDRRAGSGPGDRGRGAARPARQRRRVARRRAAGGIRGGPPPAGGPPSERAHGRGAAAPLPRTLPHLPAGVARRGAVRGRPRGGRPRPDAGVSGSRSPLAEVETAVRERGLSVGKAVPRADDHLLLDLVGEGGTVAGQWFAADVRAASIAADTRRVSGEPGVAVLPTAGGGGVVLQPRGADRRLPVLHSRAAAPHAVLVAHRPERRAVLCRTTCSGAVVYDKHVRPDRTAALVRSAAGAAAASLRVPRVVDVDLELGIVTTQELPGRTLHELLGAADVAPAVVVAAARGTGRALAALHAGAVPPGAPAHDVSAEVAVCLRWLAAARGHQVLDSALADALSQRAAALAADPGAAPVLAPLHRDLHDKQVLVPPHGPVGLLDLDLAAAGEPSLDLANLLVHLRLRALQCHTSEALARACAAAGLEEYAPSPAVEDRLAAYDRTARWRLAAVYAFRPAGAAAALALLEDCR